MKRPQRNSMIIGICAAILVVVGCALDAEDFFRSYLFAYLFVLGLSLGSLANLMLHEITGGEWGVALQLPWSAAVRLIPLTALLFIPLLFGGPHLYSWMSSSSPDVVAKGWWLNRPFFLARSAFYLIVWSVIAWRWLSLAERGERTALRALSAGGLVVYGLTISLAAVDWIMSLLPQWYSTGFGLVIGTSEMLSAMAFGVAACALQSRRERSAMPFPDFGNLLLMYVMTWAYLVFTQYLITWAEDLPKEIVWYVPRVQTSWRWLSLGLFMLQFGLPFLLLLSRAIKRNPESMGRLAAALLCAQLLFNFYLVTPVFEPQGISLSWSDPLAVLAMLGLWFSAWLRNIERYANDDGTLRPTQPSMAAS
jgi:hypothetical protein